MKRIILILSIFLLTGITINAQASSGLCEKFALKNQARKDTRAVKNIIKLQDVYSKKHDIEGMKTIYSDDFLSTDGFDKNAYITLIKDTWKTYEDIAYKTEIKNISIEGNKATVRVKETASATSTKIEEDMTAFGELNSVSEGEYYLKKVDTEWKFSGEKVDSEKSTLKYGDTRFIKMDLAVSDNAVAGEYYTSKLFVDMPDDSIAIASINREKITYPHENVEDVFRKIPDDNILERMFIANDEGKNEYNVASIGLSKARILPNGKTQIYLAGIAFVMTRVNVEAKNAE